METHIKKAKGPSECLRDHLISQKELLLKWIAQQHKGFFISHLGYAVNLNTALADLILALVCFSLLAGLNFSAVAFRRRCLPQKPI